VPGILTDLKKLTAVTVCGCPQKKDESGSIQGQDHEIITDCLFIIVWYPGTPESCPLMITVLLIRTHVSPCSGLVLLIRNHPVSQRSRDTSLPVTTTAPPSFFRHTSRPGVRSQPVQGRHMVCDSSTCRSYFLSISRVIFVSFSNLLALGRVAKISPLR